MTQPAYEYVRPYVANGDALDDIAEDLSHLTTNSITFLAAREHFVEEGLWAHKHAGGFEGIFEDALTDAGATPATVRSLEILWTTVFQSSKGTLQTTTQLRKDGVTAKGNQPGTAFVKMLNRIEPAFLTQVQVDAILALGGGLLYPEGVSEAEVQAAIDQQALDDAAEVRKQDCIAEVNRLKAGSVTADTAATNYRKTADFYQDIDHVGNTTAAYDAAFDPNA